MQWFQAPWELAETAQALRRQGLSRADAGLECLGLLFAARPWIAARADADAERALDEAEQRCLASGQLRVLQLVHDLRAGLLLRRGEIDRAWQIAHAEMQRFDTARPAPDQTVNALGLAEIALQRADFDAVLEQGYRALRCAEAVGLAPARAIATHNLAANQLNLFNLEDALPLQLEAQAALQAAGMDFVRPYVWENLILIHDAQERPSAAARTLAEWRAAVGDFSARELHDRGVAIALGLLAAGQPALALPIVEAPAPDAGGDRHRTTAWIWAKARVLLALGQAAQARSLCEDFLAASASQPHAETPYNLVRVFDVLREACEVLGDFRAALLAHKASQRAALPLLGQSARALSVAEAAAAAGGSGRAATGAEPEPAGGAGPQHQHAAAIDAGARRLRGRPCRTAAIRRLCRPRDPIGPGQRDGREFAAAARVPARPAAVALCLAGDAVGAVGAGTRQRHPRHGQARSRAFRHPVPAGRHRPPGA